MKLNDLIQTVVASKGAHWTHVPSVFLEEHTDLAIYNDDVSVSLAWGKDHKEGEPWREDWSDAFPDHDIYGLYADVRWNGVPVWRELLLAVDGHRAYLPAGRPLIENRQQVGLRVTHEQLAIARVVHDITLPMDEYDDYMRRANVQVE